MTGKTSSKIVPLVDFDADYLSGRSYVLGVDEAGRGALAGPVCAAAVLLGADFYADAKLLENFRKLDDSKRMTESERKEIFCVMENLRSAGRIDFQAAFAGVEEIGRLNILGATKLAMERAIGAINERANLLLKENSYAATLFGEGQADLSKSLLLIDGNPLRKFRFRHIAVVKGDSKSFAIAAASVVAKVSRDAYMAELSERYPNFDFAKHKGYGTALHLQNLMLYGPSEVHRKSFLKKLRAQPISNPQAELF